MMKAIFFKLTFLFSLFLTILASGQTIEGSYDNDEIFEEIYFNGLSLKPGNNFSQDEVKAAVEVKSNRIEWGIGFDWSEVEITAEEDDYHGFLTSYNYNYSGGEGFVLRIAGYSHFQSISSFSLQSPNIVVGFLNHKFIIGTTKKEEVEGLFYNGRVEKEYPNGYSDIKVFTHGGKLYFDFDPNQILQSIYLESF